MRNSRIVTTFMEASISRSEIDRCRPRAPGVRFAPWVSTSPLIALNSPWWNPASHRERRGARLTRREEGAYWAYATDEQRRQAGCIAARMQRRPPPRAVKVLSRNDMTRPRDLADLRALLRAASGHDLERARRAISLIVARGYHRDRDLETEFNDLLRA